MEKEVTKGKEMLYDEIYERLNLKEGGTDLYRAGRT